MTHNGPLPLLSGELYATTPTGPAKARRWYQISITDLLVLMLLSSVTLSLCGCLPFLFQPMFVAPTKALGEAVIYCSLLSMGAVPLCLLILTYLLVRSRFVSKWLVIVLLGGTFAVILYGSMALGISYFTTLGDMTAYEAYAFFVMAVFSGAALVESAVYLRTSAAWASVVWALIATLFCYLHVCFWAYIGLIG